MCTLDKEPDGVVQTVNCGSAQQFQLYYLRMNVLKNITIKNTPVS